MSETDPIAAAARELEARRAGTDVATVPAEPAARPRNRTAAILTRV